MGNKKVAGVRFQELSATTQYCEFSTMLEHFVRGVIAKAEYMVVPMLLAASVEELCHVFGLVTVGMVASVIGETVAVDAVVRALVDFGQELLARPGMGARLSFTGRE